MMIMNPTCSSVQQPMYEMDCNIRQEISQPAQDPRSGISFGGSVLAAPDKTENETELLDRGWNAMAAFDNENSEMECMVKEIRATHEQKAKRGRWVLLSVLLVSLLVVGAMSFAIRPTNGVPDAHMDPSEKKRPAMVRSKYQPH